MKRVFQVVVVISIVSLGSHSPAAVITVDLLGGGHYTEIQPAIDAAQEGDTVLVKPGEYVITESINFKGKAITVRGELCAGETTILMSEEPDPENSVVFFKNGENEASILEGFTLTGGSPAGVSCSRNSSPTLRNCKITRNKEGVHCFENSSPTFLNCAITANLGFLAGGVLCSENSSPTFLNCTISGNSAFVFAGGVLCSENSSPTFSNCTISGNSGGTGAVSSWESSPTLINCTISGNCCWANRGGGGLRFVRSDATLKNCTITGNRSSDGTPSGVICEESSPTLINCILWDNTGGSIEILDDASSPKVTYSLIEGEEMWPGEGNINGPPLFVFPGVFDFQRNSPDDGQLPDFIVEAGDYRLQVDSPAIDAGTPDGAPPFDAEEHGRPCGAGVDMGAYESGKCPAESFPADDADARFCNPEVDDPQPHFRRGDCNADGKVNITDGVATLLFLFAGGEEPPCRDAADTDDSGQIDINDSIGTFNWLFQGAVPPAPPGDQQCGQDPTADELSCDSFPAC